jgi:CO dehydrogenase/acetyl-CoA synthase gamma subunit (corrinoid Fe-S protein)
MSETETSEKLYDVIVPPGVPRSIIIDISKKFDVEVVSRQQPLKYANMDGDMRDLLAFRCKKDVAIQVQNYMMDELQKFIGEDNS